MAKDLSLGDQMETKPTEAQLIKLAAELTSISAMALSLALEYCQELSKENQKLKDRLEPFLVAIDRAGEG